MKKIFITAIVVSMAIAAKSQSAVTGCSDLFFSEITIGKTEVAEDLTNLNYAVEIFNPTESEISLNNYSIELVSPAQVVTSIPLSGTLASKDVFVVGNTNAENALVQLCDYLRSDLDMGANTIMVLKHDDVIIDKFGQSGTATPDNFDVASFLDDPAGYLANLHIDLYDFHNVDMRRSMLTDKGDPDFAAATSLIGEWYYAVNTDLSDIGQHTGVCKPTGTPIFGFVENYLTLFENPSLSPNYGFIHFVSSGTTGSFLAQISCAGAATWGSVGASTDGSGVPCGSMTFISDGSSLQPQVNYKHRPNNVYSDITFSSVNSDFTVDPANKTCRVMFIAWPFNAGVEQAYEDKQVKLYPTVTNDLIYLDTKETISLALFSAEGKEVLKQTIRAGNGQAIDISSLSPAMYFVRIVTTENNKTTFTRIVKK